MNESTLVPRKEMNDLDWLARDVHVWPDGKEECLVVLSKNPYPIWSVCRSSCGWIGRSEWLALRAELQNKPSWKDAPEWARCLSQDYDGAWWWYQDVPEKCEDGWWSETKCKPAAAYGEVLGDWRDTLEKRPETNEMPSHSNQPKPSTDIPECAEVKQFEPFVSVEDIGTVSETAGHQYRREIGEIAVNKYNDAMKDAATAKQPAPKGSGNPILGMVLADLTNRALEGKEKYGEPLLAHNGRNPLWDAYQEALDLAMYLRQAIEEQK